MSQKQNDSPSSAEANVNSDANANVNVNAEVPSGVGTGSLEQALNIPSVYSILIQTSLDGFSVNDLAGNILDCNPALCQMLGYSREELLKRKVSDIEAAESAPVISAHIQRIIQTGNDRFQTRLRRKDGSVIAVEISAQYVPALGQRLFVFARDISERKKAEEALLQSEENYRVLFEAESDAIFLIDDQSGHILQANPAACAMHGYSWDEIRSLSSDKLSAEVEQAEIVTRQIPPAPNQVFTFPLRWHRKKDGTIFPVEITGRFFIQAGRLVHIAAIRDITEQKKTEEALRQSEVKYRLLAENISDVIWILDATTLRFRYVSPSVERLRGYTVEEALAQDMSASITPASAARVNQVSPIHIAEFERGILKYYVEEIEQPCKDGSTVWTETSTRYSVNPENGHLEVYGVSRDISERKQAQEALRRLNDELEQRVVERTAKLQSANDELEAFSYSVSHDLRSPLRGIDGWSKVLLEDYGDRLDEQAHTYLIRVRSEAQRLGRLIDDILQLSRLSRSEMHKRPVNLSAIALEAASRLQESSPERAVELVIQPDLTASGDARLLEVALSNLFDNAFKFSAKAPCARIEFGQTSHQDETAFFVRDNGVGFDMAYATKLFGAFQRLHGVSEFPGSGIGLATVQRIIHRHGGRVWAEARVDQGAAIYFTLGD
jgi:PAS domain S-box-containing protein